MLKLESRHYLTGEELSREETHSLLALAEDVREERTRFLPRGDLTGKTLSMLFDKPSLRTRVSFTVAVQELGGQAVECPASTRKDEDAEDVAHVLEGYCHGILMRTHAHGFLERLAEASRVPVINGLSDTHHPCQVLADLLTLKQSLGTLENIRVAYIGDGNNILHSLLLLGPQFGIELRYACPVGFGPDPAVLERAQARIQDGPGSIESFTDPRDAVEDANAVYTDVWTSMGFERESDSRKEAFRDFQLNESLYGRAAPDALIMHCMPMVRGQEISEGLSRHPNAAFYKQSENRLHVQKALLIGLLGH
jgi:ornithine carbamoyltransferase